MLKLEFAQGLHQKALQAARRFKKSEIELLEILEEVDRHKIFYILKFSSLFEYATKGLNLSEELSYIYIRVARATRKIPDLKEEIREGNISISKAKKIASVLTVENQTHWLELAKSVSKRELEKEVALANPSEAIQEKVQFKASRVQLQVGVSESLMLRLRRAQDVLSQKRRRPVSLEEVLAEMTDVYLTKEDPLERAKRQKAKGRLQTTGPGTNRRPIPAASKHQVILTADAQCTHINTDGKRCPNRRFLEIHHKQPFAQGGKNDPSNLELLCSGHHRAAHERLNDSSKLAFNIRESSLHKHGAPMRAKT